MLKRRRESKWTLSVGQSAEAHTLDTLVENKTLGVLVMHGHMTLLPVANHTLFSAVVAHCLHVSAQHSTAGKMKQNG